MSEARKDLIMKAFQKCDTSGDGVLKVNDLKVRLANIILWCKDTESFTIVHFCSLALPHVGYLRLQESSQVPIWGMDRKAVSEGVPPQFRLSRLRKGRRGKLITSGRVYWNWNRFFSATQTISASFASLADRGDARGIHELLQRSVGIHWSGHLFWPDDAPDVEILKNYSKGPISVIY